MLQVASIIFARCKKLRLRTTIDTSRDPIGAKIRRGQLEKVPVMLVLG
jgi:threonyl-tRNA synthetase